MTLRLVREVGRDVGNVDRREGVSRGGGAHSNRSPTLIIHYAKSNMSLIWSLNRLNYIFKW